MAYIKRFIGLAVITAMMIAVVPASAIQNWPLGTSIIYYNNINNVVNNPTVQAGTTATINFQVENDTANGVVVSIHKPINDPSGRVCDASTQPIVSTIYGPNNIGRGYYTAQWAIPRGQATGLYCYSIRWNNPIPGAHPYVEGTFRVNLALNGAVGPLVLTPLVLPSLYPFVSSHSALPNTIVAGSNERTTISYRLGKIVSNFRLAIQDQYGREVAVLRTTPSINAGSYADVWSGRDSNTNQPVSTGTYFYVLSASGQASVSNRIYVTDPNQNMYAPVITNYYATPTTIYQDQSTVIRYEVNQAAQAEVAIYLNGSFVKQLVAPTQYNNVNANSVNEIRWYGDRTDGSIVDPGTYTFMIQARNANGVAQVRQDSVTVLSRGNNPGNPNSDYQMNVSNVYASPSPFDLRNNNTTTINYTLNQSAYVTVSMLRSNGTTAKTLVDQGFYNSGARSISWNGYDASGYRVANDVYTIVVTARSYSNGTTDEDRSSTVRVTNDGSADAGTVSIYSMSASPSTFSPEYQTSSAQFYLNRAATVNVYVIDPNGYLARTLVSNTSVSSGYHTYSWDGRSPYVQNNGFVPAGRYSFRVDANAGAYGNDVESTSVTVTRAYGPYYTYNPPHQGPVSNNNGGNNYGTVCIANFRDVYADHSLCPAIKFAVEKGIIEGYDDQTIGLDKVINRAEFMTIIQRAFGYSIESYNPYVDGTLGYSDLGAAAASNEWFMKYAKTFLKLGIVTGYDDGTLRPERTMNTAELYKAFFLAAMRAPNNIAHFSLDQYIQFRPYTDTPLDAGNQWYLPFAQLSKVNGLVTGSRFYPGRGITRGQVIELIYDTNQKGMITYPGTVMYY